MFHRVGFITRFVAPIAALMATTYVGVASMQAPQTADTDASAQNHGRGRYTVHSLVSDGFVPADHTDADLKNPRGIAFNPNGVVWVADNKTGLSTLYDGFGVKNSLIVTVPPAPGATSPTAPTGIVFSNSADFVVSSGGKSGPAIFMFATEEGTISGWNPNVDLTHAILKVDNTASHAVYKGLALAANGTGHQLYATDFHNNKIDVFDASFNAVTATGGFVDPRLPAGFAPFGIQNIQGNLYVTYARQDDAAQDNVAGPGLGVVDVFDANGTLIRRLATRGTLNAPWGIALAPQNFGPFSNMLLVGNFGDGRINAYDLASGEFRGQLRSSDGKVIALDGLWGFAFGNGVLNQPIETLFFNAGPGDQEHGLYGRIDAVSTNGNGSDQTENDSTTPTMGR